MIIVYVILFAGCLGCLFWLASRISHESQVGAYTSFLVLPAFYWTYKFWNSRRAALRVPAAATFGMLFLTVAVALVSNHIAKSRVIEDADTVKANPAMMKWCREQNDGVYDPVLKLCVEPTKADVLADEEQEHAMAAFEQYLNHEGYAGTLDRTDSAAIKALKDSPDVADAGTYRITGQGADQAPLIVALCLSQSACTHLAARQKKELGNGSYGKGRIMLLVPPGALSDAQLRGMKGLMAGFKPN